MNYTIFLADDDEDDRLFFTEAFHELSYSVNVNTFNNGLELTDGLLKTSEKPPDVFFLDLFMPLMSCEECLEAIRDKPKLSIVPIIIYSTILREQKTETLCEKGATLYLRKPNAADAFKDVLVRCVRFIDEPRNEKEDTIDFII